MWEGQYVDSLDKYVTDPKHLATLGLDKKRKPAVIDIIFQVVFMVGVVGAAVYLILQ